MNEQSSGKEIQDPKNIQDLYDFEINRFQELIKNNVEYAYHRYGITLLYSLPSEDVYTQLEELGFTSKEPLDHYNRGAIECQNGNLKEALKHFEKAESMECDRPELFYNFGVIHEEEENMEKAKEYYQKYIDLVEKYDYIPKNLQRDLDEVRNHLKEL